VSYLSLDCGDGTAVGARGRGHVRQVLDHLLRVLCLTGTRLTPGERKAKVDEGLCMKDHVQKIIFSFCKVNGIFK